MEKALGPTLPTAAWPPAAEAKHGEEGGGLKGPSGIPLPGLRELDPWTKRHWSSGAPERLARGGARGVPSPWTPGHEPKPRGTS